MEYFEANLPQIDALLKENNTHKQISNIFKTNFPEVKRGFSPRNVRLLCAKYGLARRSDHEVDNVVNRCLVEVGPTYGRKMMVGYVRSKGYNMSDKQIRRSLSRINPSDHERRRNDTVRRTNPVPYNAPYYGYKLHCDQNEKIGMYGCTLYAFSDGCSSKIVKLFSMPVKNAVIIYTYFRDLLIEEGLWDMVRVDHGTEACLMLFVQNLLKDHRGNMACPPYQQTRSRQNLPAERKWPEVNQRVLYPIKDILIRMEGHLLVDMRDPLVQFCVSYIVRSVVDIGLQRVVTSWNLHPIEEMSSRVPEIVAQTTCRVAPIDVRMVPSVDEAVQMYTDAGGNITRDCLFGVDPLANSIALCTRRDNTFCRSNPGFTDIFNNVVSGDGAIFQSAIMSFIDITKTLSP